MNEQYARIIARLQAGETVKLTANGTSMKGIIDDGDEETLAPVTDPTTIREGDAVFCRVNGNIFTHKVTGIRKYGDRLKFQISRHARPRHVNGWAWQEQIYGILVAVNGVPVKRKGERK